MSSPKKQLVETQVMWKAKSKDGKTPRMIPLKELSSGHLQRAFWSVQKRYCELQTKIENLMLLEELLESEAEKRGVELKDYNPDFAKSTKKAE